MNLENILEACKWIFLVIFGGLALYFKYNTALKDRVTGAINEAEEAYKDQTQIRNLILWLILSMDGFQRFCGQSLRGALLNRLFRQPLTRCRLTQLNNLTA